MKKVLLLLVAVVLFSCGKKEEVKPDVKVNNFIGKSFAFEMSPFKYTIEFTTDSECTKSSPDIFGNGVNYDFMSYTYNGNNGIISNPHDGCSEHTLRLIDSEMHLTHSNGFVNIYNRVK